MLFADWFESPQPGRREALGPEAYVLRGFALDYVPRLLPELRAIQQAAPARHLVTPGGRTMSVALSNCGQLGWTSSRDGYRYTAHDPDTGKPWPPMPAVFLELAQAAAAQAGHPGFAPDACLVNHYVPGARLTLHQDRDENDLGEPIVSVSLGIPATFVFGGLRRTDPTQRVPVFHGDVVVWGGVDRLRYHGVLPVKEAEHPELGRLRINFTFRRAR
ncbi:DNA oxidative demethylase AlkB [Bordetella genomosp. 13]|uniref:Alpha-ketoglutarate-dependent dioxygenase AlkB n=1 Tax=Bordetella genomosp. 13 TaxID=463040 RepID=A0A1W6Z7C0_9BORD|nr:DNA oxidative demethylase AlkB [Bordetella genomosp. 13]ARP93207.1 alpha-ketoglutarate-dependent dioxygenase AlkB [Bordetella genomosp. 13]